MNLIMKVIIIDGSKLSIVGSKISRRIGNVGMRENIFYFIFINTFMITFIIRIKIIAISLFFNCKHINRFITGMVNYVEIFIRPRISGASQLSSAGAVTVWSAA